MAERPEDLNLPLSVVQRIIKDSLPPGIVVSKEAKIAIGKAASVFVLYATSCANTVASRGKRKTLSGYDVIQSMSDMEFDKFVPQLQECYEEFKRGQRAKKETSAKKKMEKENASNQESEDAMPMNDSEIITLE